MKLIKYLKIKKMVKLINVDIKVKFAKRLECEPENAKIYVGFKNNEMENRTFKDYVKELQPNVCKYSDMLLGVLHEIGHIYTIEQADESEYLQDVDLLYKLREKDLISAEQMNYFYLRLPLESLATKWAIDFININKAFCDKWDNELM